MFDIYTIRRMNSSGELSKAGVMDRYNVKRHQVSRAANNSWKVYLSGHQCLAYIYHRTEVVSVYLDGSVKLNTGGWDTVTTRDRINRFQGRVRVSSVKGDWVVWSYDSQKLYPFIDGMRIDRLGQAWGPSGQIMDPLPQGSATLAARMGNLITEGIIAWQHEADQAGSKDTSPEPCRLYTIIDKLEAMGLERTDAWDIMDPHVHEKEA